MRTILRRWLLVAIVALVPSFARSDEPAESAKGAGQELRGLIDDFTKAQQAFMLEYRGATTDDQRRELIEKKMPKTDQVAAKIIELVTKTPADPGALDGLEWILRNAREPQSTGPALKLIIENHANSDKLVNVFRALTTQISSDAEDLTRLALEKNPHHEVQGWACFALAQQLKQRTEIIAIIASQPELKDRVAQFYGEEFAKRLATTDAKALSAEVERLLERVAKEFADVSDGSLAKSVERELYEIQHLAIGKVAPEIEGEDVDGVAFKLSEYRGKVVVLDFWGDW